MRAPDLTFADRKTITLGNDRLDAWLNSIRAVEMLDFDTVLPAHEKVGSKVDVTAHRHYIEN